MYSQSQPETTANGSPRQRQKQEKAAAGKRGGGGESGCPNEEGMEAKEEEGATSVRTITKSEPISGGTMPTRSSIRSAGKGAEKPTMRVDFAGNGNKGRGGEEEKGDEGEEEEKEEEKQQQKKEEEQGKTEDNSFEQVHHKSTEN
jgi:hypothetical protein